MLSVSSWRKTAKQGSGMKMTTNTKRLATLVKCCAALCFAACSAHASIIYTFTATTSPAPSSPPHSEVFQLQLPDFLSISSSGPVISFFENDPAVISCVACANPPVPAFHFLRGPDSDMIQFADADNTTRLYTFPLNALSNIGTYSTLAGINVNRGALAVASVPEPSTASLLMIGTSAIAWCLYTRRRTRARSSERDARPAE